MASSSAGRSTGKSLSFETEERDPKRQRLWESQIAKRLNRSVSIGDNRCYVDDILEFRWVELSLVDVP